MSQAMFYAPAFQVSASEEYTPSGTSTPDPTIKGGVQVTASSPPTDPPPSGPYSPPSVEVIVHDGGTLEVRGFVSDAACQQAVDAAVAAAALPEASVLPAGYLQATTRNAEGVISKIRITTPGGRWVEYDPTDNTFRS